MSPQRQRLETQIDACGAAGGRADGRLCGYPLLWLPECAPSSSCPSFLPSSTISRRRGPSSTHAFSPRQTTGGLPVPPRPPRCPRRRPASHPPPFPISRRPLRASLPASSQSEQPIAIPDVYPYIPGTPHSPPSNITLPYPILLHPRQKNQYFVERQSFNVMGMLGNPMILMMVVTGVLVFAMPYIMVSFFLFGLVLKLFFFCFRFSFFFFTFKHPHRFTIL